MPGKYKFRVGEKAIIEADLAEAARSAKLRRGNLDYIEPEYPGRRLSDHLITFFDLGQVNHQDPDDEPVWVDHPILKTPGYTTEAIKFGGPLSGTPMAQFQYDVDPFDDADFQAFTDTMFNYPVTEWNQRYRQITIPDNDTADLFTFDMRFSLQDESAPYHDNSFLAFFPLDRDVLGTSYTARKNTFLTDRHFAFEIDREGAIYRHLAELTCNSFTGPGAGAAGYFSLSTANKDLYKVTRTYDPNAADIGTLTPHGKIEVYLMPQIGLWAATSNSVDYLRTEVLGLCFQVQPRHLWPRYIDPVTNESGGYGADVDVAAYFDYQQNRLGMQYSVWEFLGYDGSDPANPIVSETPGSVSLWTGQNQYGFATSAGTNLDASWYSSAARSGTILSDDVTQFTTSFRSNGDSPDFGNQLFQCSSTFLTAVFKMGGQFYYVWDITGAFGNNTCFQTLQQGERFKLARGITWDPGVIENITPLDGTTTTFYQ